MVAIDGTSFLIGSGSGSLRLHLTYRPQPLVLMPHPHLERHLPALHWRLSPQYFAHRTEKRRTFASGYGNCGLKFRMKSTACSGESVTSRYLLYSSAPNTPRRTWSTGFKF